jgi:NADPH:quinone reductase-like Zn-dependent oxidoreductase
MKAIVYTEYGPPDVLQFIDVATPAPKDDEVLIRIHAASVNALDWRLLRGKPALARVMTGGLFKPKRNIPGADVAGRVEAVGRNVTEFQPGDEVFGGIGTGGFAEYACATEDRLVGKPAGVSYEQAAAVPVAALTALQALRDAGRIQPGQNVLIDGASGGVGTFAVQIAKSFGAEVTAVCSKRAMATARSIGADHVIDYSAEDFTRSGQLYDLIVAANAHHSIFDYKRALKPGGIYVMAGGGGKEILQAMLLGSWISRTGNKKMGILMAKRNKKDFVFLKDLLETRKMTPVIDRRYPLRDAADAIRYLEQGHAKGKVVITVVPDGAAASQA